MGCGASQASPAPQAYTDAPEASSSPPPASDGPVPPRPSNDGDAKPAAAPALAAAAPAAAAPAAATPAPPAAAPAVAPAAAPAAKSHEKEKEKDDGDKDGGDDDDVLQLKKGDFLEVLTAAKKDGKLASYKGISLKECGVVAIPAPLLGGAARHITTLSMQGCRIDKDCVTEIVAEFPALTDLDLGVCGLTPDAITPLATLPLTSLGLYQNELTALPDVFSAASCAFLGTLKSLNLFNNKFRGVLPAGVAAFPALTELNVGSNRLIKVPAEAVAPLKQLSRLALHMQTLVMLPSFGPLVGLTVVQLNSNKLETFPEFGPVHASLKEINLSSNIIATIPADVFTAERFPQLETLEMMGNKLTVIPAELARVVAMRKLNFTKNAVEVIPAELFSLPLLTTLMLEENVVRELPAEVGKAAGSLVNLLLAGNRISTVPATMAQCTKLTKVTVKGNPLDMSDATTKSTLAACEKIVKASGPAQRWA